MTLSELELMTMMRDSCNRELSTKEAQIDRLTTRWDALRLYHVEASERALSLNDRATSQLHENAVIHMDRMERES